jgi:hypothetical protein
MNLDGHTFTVHDASAFPIVFSRADAVVPGYAVQWETEMNMLLAQGSPFVVVFPAMRTEETHEDRKRRGLWLKRNKQALAGLCRCLIAIEPDSLKRLALKAQTAMATKAFGIPMQIVSSPEEATTLADRLISAEPLAR